jgi:cysteine-rich repeat protein
VCEGSPSHCRPTTCGDGKREGLESCDDGNTKDGDLCSARCRLETDCNDAGVCKPLCGNGVMETEEACDDGNLLDRDGCSAACALEVGYYCSLDVKRVTECYPLCGDGLRLPSEACDDGDLNANDKYAGCTLTCTLSPRGCGDGVVDAAYGEVCDLGPGNDDTYYGGCTTACVIGPRCGDGIVQPLLDPNTGSFLEECDDGNDLRNDGCFNCHVESPPR